MANIFPSAFETSQFTFSVDGRDIQVHCGVVTAHSEPLSKVINGDWKESRESRAELVVERDTFLRALEFMYQHAYTDPIARPYEQLSEDKEDVTDVEQTTKVLYNDDDNPEGIALVEYGFDEFESPVVTKSNKKKKSKSRSKSNTFGYESSEEKSLLESFKEKEFGNFTMCCSFPAINWKPPKSDDTLDWFPALMEHAKLYIFADMYRIESLKLLVLYKMHATLKIVKITPENAASVTELIRLIFDSTPDLTGSVEPMRDLISQYAAANFTALRGDTSFRDLLQTGGEFVTSLTDILYHEYIEGID